MPDTPDSLKKKSRDVLLGTTTARTDSFNKQLDGNVVTTFGPTINSRVLGRQVTASEGHLWDAASGYQGDDVGGPFETTRRYLSFDRYGQNPVRVEDIPKYSMEVQPQAGGGYRFRGHLHPTSLSVASAWPLPEPSSNSTLMALGAKAIAITKPTNSIADLSVSLAEVFREGLPSAPGRTLWKERADKARGAGSEYLNAQFGWLPLVSEIENVTKAIRDGDKLWKQFERDAGKLVRRRFEYPVSYSGPQEVSGGGGRYPFPTPNTYFYPLGYTGGDYHRTRYKRQRQWFSGAFTYYLPNKDSSSAIARMDYAATKARFLYGITLDPEVLWNLTPWSWAADWFVNTGDVISNLTDFATDGLVLRYGYMMEETIVSDQHTLSGLRWSSSGGPGSLTIYCVTKTLKRIRATPYGFGLTFDGFSPRQLAILAALGITRR